MSFLNLIYQYWYVIVVVVAVIIYAIYELRVFYKLSNSEKVKKIKAVLYALVAKAAEKYDEGSYDLIFASVYNAFTEKYPILKAIIPLDTIRDWVSEAFTLLKKNLAAQGKTFASLHNPTILK